MNPNSLNWTSVSAFVCIRVLLPSVFDDLDSKAIIGQMSLVSAKLVVYDVFFIFLGQIFVSHMN